MKHFHAEVMDFMVVASVVFQAVENSLHLSPFDQRVKPHALGPGGVSSGEVVQVDEGVGGLPMGEALSSSESLISSLCT